MSPRVASRVVAVGLAAAALAGTALASNPALFFKFEISAAYAWETPRLKSSYVHSYAPPYSPWGYRSSAGQTLAFEGRRAGGYATGLRYFPIPHFGLEVLYDAFKAKMTGANSSYAVDLDYIVRVPPANVPAEQAYQHETPWPDTDGEFKETVLSVNAVVRAALGSRLSVKVSGGASFCAFEAQSAHIGFTKFWLGGYTTLFKQDYKLGLDWGKTKAAGFNIGGEAVLDLFSNMGLAVDVRYFSFADVEAAWKVMTGEGISETPEALGRLMNLRPVSVDPSLFRIGLGLRFLF
jgi:hypothetical protein